MYDTSNSAIPSNDVWAIVIDDNENIWIGTPGGGMAKLSGNTWELFDSGNSGLPHNDIRNLTKDHENRIWISTYNGGVAMYDAGATTAAGPHASQLNKGFVLRQNYPNPFNPSTRIKYQLPQAGHIALKIYNILGQEMANLVDQFQLAGEYEVAWNAFNFPNGIYFYRLSSGEFVETKKLLLVK